MSRKHTASSGWIRNFLCATALVATSSLALGACEKKEAEKSAAGSEAEPPMAPAKTTAAEPPAASKKVVGEELIQKILKCNESIESWDKEAFKECFAEDADVRFLDSIPPSQAKGRTPVVVQYGMFRNAFSDFKLELPLILVNGTKSAVVSHIAGTHANASLGIPPTGKKMSILQAETADHDEKGQTTWIRSYDDQSTLFHQLGLMASEAAAGAEKKPWAEAIRLVAKGDDGERANLEAVKKGIEAQGKGDVAGALAMYAPDATFRYQPEAKPFVGRAEIEANLRSYSEVSTSSVDIRDSWAAGDWVVAELTTKVKLTKDLPGVKGSKGKGWELSSLDLFRVAGGKVAEHWRFVNGLKFAADMGFVDPATLGGE